MAGGAVACVGEAIRIWAAGHLNKSREVTSSGPYRWSAHPLYVGSTVMGVGLAIASGRAIVAALIAAYLDRRADGGDQDARRRFCAARLAMRTIAIGAGTRPPIERRRDRRFSLAQAMANHEHRALIGLVLAMLLLALKAARTYNDVFWRTAGPLR